MPSKGRHSRHSGASTTQPGLGTTSDDYGPAATCRSMDLAAAAGARGFPIHSPLRRRHRRSHRSGSGWHRRPTTVGYPIGSPPEALRLLSAAGPAARLARRSPLQPPRVSRRTPCLISPGLRAQVSACSTSWPGRQPEPWADGVIRQSRRAGVRLLHLGVRAAVQCQRCQSHARSGRPASIRRVTAAVPESSRW
jgi:hypothetical protein